MSFWKENLMKNRLLQTLSKSYNVDCKMQKLLSFQPSILSVPKINT